VTELDHRGGLGLRARPYHAAVRRLLFLVALTTAIVLPAGALAGNPVLAAAKRSSTAKSTKLQIQMATTVPGVARTVVSGSGATRGRSVTLSVTTTVAGRSVPMDAVGLMEHGSYVMYMRSPVFDAQLPTGKSWLRIDLQAQGAGAGIDFGSLIGQSETLAPLAHGLVSTRRVARERVSGRPTTHYRAVVDLRKAARAVPAYAKQLAGRISRLRTTTPTAVQGVRGTSVQTMTFLSYDTPVSIVAPPASQVFAAG
jgi:hypothetical protein